MHMPRLVLLRDHLEYSDTFALWVHQQFAYEYSEQPLVDATQALVFCAAGLASIRPGRLIALQIADHSCAPSL
jgi:hypothetical protein